MERKINDRGGREAEGVISRFLGGMLGGLLRYLIILGGGQSACIYRGMRVLWISVEGWLVWCGEARGGEGR